MPHAHASVDSIRQIQTTEFDATPSVLARPGLSLSVLVLAQRHVGIHLIPSLAPLPRALQSPVSWCLLVSADTLGLFGEAENV